MQKLQGTKLDSSVIYLLQGSCKAFYHLSYCKQQQLGDNMIMSNYDELSDISVCYFCTVLDSCCMNTAPM